MAFKLSKGDLARREKLVKELGEALAEVTAAVEAFNTGIDTLRTDIEQAVADYNEVVAEAKGFADDIASQAENEIDEKSDAWREGERGQAAEEWQGEWANLDLDEIEVDIPDPIDFDEPDHGSALEEAPEEASA